MIAYEPVEAVTMPALRIRVEGRSFVCNFASGTDNTGGGGELFSPEIGSASFVASIPDLTDVPETFDWSSKTIRHEFILLEQKTLAGKAKSQEEKRYRAMRSDRNKGIFADRYFRDYAEIQRLKTLSQKLAELQKFLRPIPMSDESAEG